MNILLIEKSEITGNKVILSDRRAKHIIRILKVNPGDYVKTGLINGQRGRAKITSINRKRPLTVELEVELEGKRPAVPFVDLVIALPRPIMLRRIISQVTALGVGAIHIINANRVEKSFWEANLLKDENIREHILAGLEQSGDTRMVPVTLHKRFLPFVEDYLPEILPEYERFLVADPSGMVSMRKTAAGLSGRCLLAVGPEGGWVDFELDKFQEVGGTVCSIGERILKVDTAVIALHSQISAVSGHPLYHFSDKYGQK